MSSFDELVHDLCPNGVERVELGELAELVRGSGLPKSVLMEQGDVGAIHYGQLYTRYGSHADTTFSYVTSEVASKLKMVHTGDLIVTNTSENFEDVGTALAWLGDEDIVTGGHTTILRHQMAPKYLAYWFKTYDFEFQKQKVVFGTKVSELGVKALAKFLVPNPPLEIQQEIVRILDLFVDLDQELEQEIIGREKQFETMRREILSGVDADYATLGSIAERVSTGATPKATEDRYHKNGDIPWLKTGEIDFNEISETENYITQAAVGETAVSWIEPNCVIVAISGATAGKVAVNKIPVTTNQHCCNFQIDYEQADYRYVFHAVSSEYESLKSRGRGARGDLNTTIIKSFEIPLPPLEVQEEIASKLDTFIEYIDNLKRERELRQQQYAHYRDLLLDLPVKE